MIVYKFKISVALGMWLAEEGRFSLKDREYISDWVLEGREAMGPCDCLWKSGSDTTTGDHDAFG